MYRAIIIDDEQTGINTLKVLIERDFNNIKIVAETTDPFQGITLVENYKPEIVFLDISMPKIDGFELLEKLSYKSFKLVFTTAHEQYAIKAIKNKAFDYLLKPIDRQDLKICIDKILTDFLQPLPNKTLKPSILELSAKDGIVFLRPEEIIRLEASGSYTVFYLESNEKYIASKNLKECTALLDNWDYFFRCHSSHTINLKKVVKMVSTNGLFVKMNDGSMPELLRKNKDMFLMKLKTI